MWQRKVPGRFLAGRHPSEGAACPLPSSRISLQSLLERYPPAHARVGYVHTPLDYPVMHASQSHLDECAPSRCAPCRNVSRHCMRHGWNAAASPDTQHQGSTYANIQDSVLVAECDGHAPDSAAEGLQIRCGSQADLQEPSWACRAPWAGWPSRPAAMGRLRSPAGAPPTYQLIASHPQGQVEEASLKYQQQAPLRKA